MLKILKALCVAIWGTALTSAQAEPIRLGWQTPWATQGQLVMALKHSNIPDLAGIELSYSGFAYGGPLNQAALAGSVDVLLTADQPAAALIARSGSFKIVARMMYNRTCLYVPQNSPVESLGDLAGKRVGGPVGAAAERVALSDLAGAGVSLDGVQFSSLDMAQQSVIVQRDPAATDWGTIDALYGFDPLPAAFEEKGLVRMVSCGKVLSLVLASDEMIRARREELVGFLQAFHAAWAAFAAHPEDLNRQFLTEAGLELSTASLDIAAEIEPNRHASDAGDIRLTFTDEDAEIFGAAVGFLNERGIMTEQLELRSPDVVDLGPLEEALRDQTKLRTIVEATRLDM